MRIWVVCADVPGTISTGPVRLVRVEFELNVEVEGRLSSVGMYQKFLITLIRRNVKVT